MFNLLSMSLLKRECVSIRLFFVVPTFRIIIFVWFIMKSRITISIVHGSNGSGNLNLVMARLRQP